MQRPSRLVIRRPQYFLNLQILAAFRKSWAPRVTLDRPSWRWGLNRSIVIYGFTGHSHALTDIFSHDAVSGAVYFHHKRRGGDEINLRGEDMVEGSSPQRYTAATNQGTSRGKRTLQLRVPASFANENVEKWTFHFHHMIISNQGKERSRARTKRGRGHRNSWQ